MDKFLRLKQIDRILLIQAAVLLATVRLGIRALPFRFLREISNRMARPAIWRGFLKLR